MSFLKKLVNKLKPSSLVAQMMLVVLLALIIAQALSLFILGSAYRTVLSDINQRARFQQVESLIYLLEDSPREEYKAILSAVRAKGVWFNVSSTSSIDSNDMAGGEKRLAKKLEEQLGDDYRNRTRIVINRLKENASYRKDCSDRNDCYEPKKDRSDHRYSRFPRTPSQTGQPESIGPYEKWFMAEPQSFRSYSAATGCPANIYFSGILYLLCVNCPCIYGAQDNPSNANAGKCFSSFG